VGGQQTSMKRRPETCGVRRSGLRGPDHNLASNVIQCNLEVAVEALPPGYWTHGSVHELAVPIVIHNAPEAPQPGFWKAC
jgi:hypothetical protein